MNFLRFLFSKTFLVNLLVAIVLIAVLIWIVFKSLGYFTLHGETVTVPDFTSLSLEELDDFVKDKHVQYVVADSVYDLDKPRGTVVRQNPKAESQVKEDRKIYLTVNAKMPPMVAVPGLQDLPLRQALAILETYGLKIGELIYKPDLCENCVLRIEVKGKEIEPGTMLVKGSSIDLVLGQGESGTLIPVPYVIGMVLDSAESRLKSHSLNVGGPFFDAACKTAEDSAQAKVYRQSPGWGKESFINMGKSIDLWLTVDTGQIEIIPDSILQTDTLPPDSTTQ